MKEILLFYFSFQTIIKKRFNMNFSLDNPYFNNNQSNRGIEILTDIVGYYLTSAVSFIGLSLNLFISVTLRRKELKNSFYRYLWFKALIDIFICVIGIGYFKSFCHYCPSTSVNTYGVLFYQWYVIKANLTNILIISSWHEIYSITQRYYKIQNKQSFLVNIKLKYYVPFIILIPVCFYINFYFFLDIQPHNHGKLYVWKQLNENNVILSLFFLIMIFMECILPVILLIIIGTITIIAFKKQINKRSHLPNSITRYRRKENRRTILILSFTLLFIISRSANAIVTIALTAVTSAKPLCLFNLSVVNLARQLCFLMYFSLPTINVFLYMRKDKKIFKAAKNQFIEIKVNRIKSLNSLIK